MDLRRYQHCTPRLGSGRMETVSAPPPYAGVGDALRRAYVGQPCEMPSDFTLLLEKLR